MLTLELAPYADTTWTWSDNRYHTSDDTGEITPFPHPMVESLATTDGIRTLIVIRERIAGRATAEPAPRPTDAAGYDAARAVVERWPADFVLVETTPRDPVRVTAGPCRTTPLYLASDATTLYGSWDMADLRRHAGGLSVREASRLLTFRPRYGSETLFTGIHRLTERATATYGDNLHIHYPTPALHRTARELDPDADVLDAFVQAIDDALDLRPLDPARTTFHLTGGFDSGCVATRAAQRRPGAYDTATLLIAGPGRIQQTRRRRQMRAAVPFAPRDTIVDAARELPFDPSCARVLGAPVSPYEEALHHPFTTLTALLADQGTETLVTGLGGDEMVALSQEELPHLSLADYIDPTPWIGDRVAQALEFADDAIAPPAAINSMTLLALETTAPILLRHGIWPVHPFADPHTVRLGEWLPIHWRELKQLQRRRMAALGLGEDVVHPTERESFAEVVQHALTTHGIDLLETLLRDGSPLIDTGLVDPDALRIATRRLATGPYTENLDAQLIEVIDLHLAAIAYL